MRRGFLLLVILLSTLFGMGFTQPPAAVVYAVFFYTPGCVYCEEAIATVLPPLETQYGAQLNIQRVALRSVEEINALYAAAPGLGLKKEQVGVPLLVIGKDTLVGLDAIREQLPPRIKQGLASGGIARPALPTEIAGLAVGAAQAATPRAPVVAAQQPLPGDTAKVHGLYFFTADCSVCQDLLEKVVRPLQTRFGAQLDLRLLEVNTPDYNALLQAAESMLQISPYQRQLPLVWVGDTPLKGETDIRSRLTGLVEQAMAGSGAGWPFIPGLDPAKLTNSDPAAPVSGACQINSPASCDPKLAVYAAFFAPANCPECSRARADLAYLKSKYAQLTIEEYNLDEQAVLAAWLGRSSLSQLSAPMLFIGRYGWSGPNGVTPAAVSTRLVEQGNVGLPRAWGAFDLVKDPRDALGGTRHLGWVSALWAGLVDGFSPAGLTMLLLLTLVLASAGGEFKPTLIHAAWFALGLTVIMVLLAVCGLQGWVWSNRTVMFIGRGALVAAAVFGIKRAISAGKRKGEPLGVSPIALPWALMLAAGGLVGLAMQSSLAPAVLPALLMTSGFSAAGGLILYTLGLLLPLSLALAATWNPLRQSRRFAWALAVLLALLAAWLLLMS